MIKKELITILPSNCRLADKFILITTSEIKRLEGTNISNCRILMLVSQGCIILQIDKKEFEIKAHMLLDIITNSSLQIRYMSNDLKTYCILPEFEFVRESLKSLKPGPTSYIIDRIYFPVLHFSEEEQKIIEQQILLIQNSLLKTKHFYRTELVMVYFRSFMLEIGNIMLIQHEQEKDSKNAILSKRDVITLRFIELVWDNCKTEHNITFYADKLCISAKHLSRIIKEVLNKTPHNIINDELLHHAMTMLEDNQMTVQQVSESLHFSDQASFCKFFKKHRKISPINYRKGVSF